MMISLWVDVYEQKEATEVFFAVTKLFQSKDIGLRRMVYLMIKEICPSSDEVIFFYAYASSELHSLSGIRTSKLEENVQTPSQHYESTLALVVSCPFRVSSFW